MVALPYEWIDKDKAIFTSDDKTYGIFVDYLELTVTGKINTIANISFGIIKGKFDNVNDLDTSITNVGKPRTILSTVSEACLANKEIINCDIISLAATDQAKEKRLNIYSLATSEIKSKIKAFNSTNTIYVKTKNNTLIIILSKIAFNEEEQLEISQKLKIDKL